MIVINLNKNFREIPKIDQEISYFLSLLLFFSKIKIHKKQINE